MRMRRCISMRQTSTASNGSLPGSHWGPWLTIIRGGVIGFLMVSFSLVFGDLPSIAAPSVSAPEFTLKAFNGNTYSKTSLQGRPTLLVFGHHGAVIAKWNCRFSRSFIRATNRSSSKCSPLPFQTPGRTWRIMSPPTLTPLFTRPPMIRIMMWRRLLV